MWAQMWGLLSDSKLARMWAETMDFAWECPMAIPMGIRSEIPSATMTGSG